MDDDGPFGDRRFVRVKDFLQEDDLRAYRFAFGGTNFHLPGVVELFRRRRDHPARRQYGER
jgi:hypothetical protein